MDGYWVASQVGAPWQFSMQLPRFKEISSESEWFYLKRIGNAIIGYRDFHGEKSKGWTFYGIYNNHCRCIEGVVSNWGWDGVFQAYEQISNGGVLRYVFNITWNTGKSGIVWAISSEEDMTVRSENGKPSLPLQQPYDRVHWLVNGDLFIAYYNSWNHDPKDIGSKHLYLFGQISHSPWKIVKGVVLSQSKDHCGVFIMQSINDIQTKLRIMSQDGWRNGLTLQLDYHQIWDDLFNMNEFDEFYPELWLPPASVDENMRSWADTKSGVFKETVVDGITMLKFRYLAIRTNARSK